MPFGQALEAIATALQRLQVGWFVWGSVASLMYGEIRTTQNVDIVLDIGGCQIGELVAALPRDFFVDPLLVTDCMRNGTSCNVIHRATGMKVDLFPIRGRKFSEVEMERRTMVPLLPGVQLAVATAEDCLLTKLEWFEKGGRTSDRQWRDILGIVRLQGSRLDGEHLRRWAAELGVADLLQRALRGDSKPAETRGD